MSFLPYSWLLAVWRWGGAPGQRRHRWLRGAYCWYTDKLKNRDGTIAHGVGKGLRFNSGLSEGGFLLGLFEPDVQAAMALLLRPAMVVYDIGANVGFHACIAAKLVGKEGRVICFEPLPSNANQIEHNLRLNAFNHMTVRREAVGATDGEAQFQVSRVATFGKLRSSGWNSHSQEESGQITVTVRQLDRLLGEGLLPRPDLIVMDVEGAEIAALSGAHRTLREVRPILIIELHETHAGVADALKAADYHVLGLDTRGPVIDLYPNARIIAVPRERGDLVHAVDNLSMSR